MKRKVKFHTFKLGKYRIVFEKRIDGFTMYPDEIIDGKPVCYDWKSSEKEIWIVKSGILSELDTTLHEAMHAEGIPEEHIHNGGSARLSRFLWRLGYRKC